MSLVFDLFRTFLLLGVFSFGGGMASMELIRSRVVAQHGWLTNSDFTDLISISEMTPGPLGINIATFTGIQIAGFPGMLAATIGYTVPPIIIVMIMAHVYYKYRNLPIVDGVLKGLRPAVVAMILASVVKLAGNAWWGGIENLHLPTLLTDTSWVAVALTGIALVLIQKKIIGPVQGIILCGVVGGIIYGLFPV